ncbi:MAG: hypothetical protein KatS3mg105_4394 [Gemmatales bacterium]|nr:MAG: hypothetical protein KatS3mg105_4394 [Gemmatales bacterium]
MNPFDENSSFAQLQLDRWIDLESGPHRQDFAVRKVESVFSAQILEPDSSSRKLFKTQLVAGKECIVDNESFVFPLRSASDFERPAVVLDAFLLGVVFDADLQHADGSVTELASGISPSERFIGRSVESFGCNRALFILTAGAFYASRCAADRH